MRKCEGVSRPFASDTSPKRIDREGLGKRRIGTRQTPPIKLRASLISTHSPCVARVWKRLQRKLLVLYCNVRYSVCIHYPWFLTQGNHGTHLQPSQAWRWIIWKVFKGMLLTVPCEQRLHFRDTSWRVKSSHCRQPFNFLSCMRKIRHAIRKQLVREICVSFAGIKLAKTTCELLSSSSFCFVFLLRPLWF